AAAAGVLHDPSGLVSHTVALRGIEASDNRTRAVSMLAAPMLLAAIAKTPVPPGPPVREKPSLDGVSPTAIMSGTGVVLNVSSNVLMPDSIGAGFVFVQVKLSCTSVGASGAVGVKATTNVCALPAGIEMGVFGVPIKVLVVGLVVWYVNVAGTFV